MSSLLRDESIGAKSRARSGAPRHRLSSRDELIEALWPRRHPAATETALNALVSKLRKILGPGVVDGRSSLRLPFGRAAIWC